MKSDASVAVGIVRRRGLGKVRHLAVADLWVQQKAHRGELIIEKVGGAVNPADLMTKGLDRPKIEQLAKLAGMCAPCQGNG